MSIHREVEVKLRVADAAAVRRKLAKLGAKTGASGRVHEMNTVFDTPQGGLAKHGQLLRIRVVKGGKGRKGGRGGRGKEGPRAVLTFKGPAEGIVPGAISGTSERYKIREEREVELSDPEGLKQILEALGLRGWFRYEKYRTTYAFPKSQRWAAGLQVMMDETPIGSFLELEGPREAIDRAAEVLGFDRGEYITKSYLALYIDDCRRRGVDPKEMVFGAERRRKE